MHSENASPVSVAILAGGKSRRMGEDKAQVRLADNGPTLLQIALDAAQTLADDVMVIGRPRMCGSPAIRWIADRHIGAGPLGGLATALHASRQDRVLVLSCDAPFLSVSVLRYLVDLPMTTDAIIPVTFDRTRQGNAETLHTLQAIYRRSCLASIEAQLASGNLRTTPWLAEVAVRRVVESELRRLDPELRSFLAVNTPAELQFARSLVSTRHGDHSSGR